MIWELSQLVSEVYMGRARGVRRRRGARVLTQYGKELDRDRRSRQSWTTSILRGIGLCFGRGGRLVRGSAEERRRRGEEGLSESYRLWNGSLVNNGSTQRVKVVVRWTTMRVVRGTERRQGRQGIRASEYTVRMGLASMGLMLLSSTNDRVSLYLCLEWQALVLYVLASFQRYSARSTEAGLKYFIQGSVMSGVYLLGCGRLYGRWGSLNLTERHRRGLWEGNGYGEKRGGMREEGVRGESLRESETRPARLGLMRVRSTLRFKLAAVPFHAWAPDVYEGSPTPSSRYFAAVPKIVILAQRIRVVSSFVWNQGVWRTGLRGVSVMSRSLAPFAARAQTKWKRFLAYSSIANVGNILLALAMGGYSGFQAVWSYAVVYAVTVVRVWLSLGSLVKRGREEGGRVERSVQYIQELDGLSESNSVLAYTIALGILSSAGLPPFAMFYAKRSVLFSARRSEHRRMPLYVVRISVVTTFYYLRFVKIRFFKMEIPMTRVMGSQNVAGSRIVGRTRRRMPRFLVDASLLMGGTAWMSRASGV